MSEQDTVEATRRARRNRNFWMLVFTGSGLTYTDIKGMDLGEYTEAIEARILFNTEWSKQRGG